MSIMPDFVALYTDKSQVTKSPNKWIIMSTNQYKIMWDLFVLLLLILVSIIVPWRVAFVDTDNQVWRGIYYTVDGLFAIDIVLTFFTGITSDDDVKEITDPKVIAKTYLRGWFIIDVISVMPMDLFLDLQVNVLVRFTKIGKLYKLIRMTRLAKVLKILKSKSTVVSQFTEKMKINSGVERLFFFFIFFVFFVHIFACLYVFVGYMDSDESSWVNSDKLDGYDSTDLYNLAVYFIVTTVTTVGYGDWNANTQVERYYCMFIMLSGVTLFTFISGALSSILSNYDHS
jgi:hypothetical protein